MVISSGSKRQTIDVLHSEPQLHSIVNILDSIGFSADQVRVISGGRSISDMDMPVASLSKNHLTCSESPRVIPIMLLPKPGYIFPHPEATHSCSLLRIGEDTAPKCEDQAEQHQNLSLTDEQSLIKGELTVRCQGIRFIVSYADQSSVKNLISKMESALGVPEGELQLLNSGTVYSLHSEESQKLLSSLRSKEFMVRYMQAFWDRQYDTELAEKDLASLEEYQRELNRILKGIPLNPDAGLVRMRYIETRLGLIRRNTDRLGSCPLRETLDGALADSYRAVDFIYRTLGLSK